MARVKDSESRVLEVYDRLRSDILDRTIRPGERLRQLEEGRRLGVSAGVMREALALLATQGLVRVERNRGFFVTTLSEQSFTEVIEARRIVEGAAIARSVRDGDVRWEADVLAAHHRLTQEPQHVDGDPARRSPTWAAAHLDLHRALLGACGNALILQMCERMWDSSELHRAWAAAVDSERDVAGEHAALVEAALARDADRAARLLEQHIQPPADFALHPDVAASG